MSDELKQDPEQLQAIIDERQAQLEDPQGYAKAKQITAIEGDYAFMVEAVEKAGLGQDALDKLAQQREAALASLDPEPVIVSDRLTAASLGYTKATSMSAPKWTATQYVEPERDGKPWCTQEDAEEMLVKALKPMLIGQGGLKPTKYLLKFDTTNSELTLSVA